MKKICDKAGCNGKTFTVEIKQSCDECEFNGAFEPSAGEYVYDKEIIEDKDLERNQASEEGECELGQSEDNGCYLFRCVDCGSESHMHLVND